MSRIWMVRSEGGSLYDIFKERNVVAIGWEQIAQSAIQGLSRKELQKRYLEVEPYIKKGNAISSSSQVWRFVNEIEIGDWVVTYSPINRTYLLGKISDKAEYHPELAERNMSLTRGVVWESTEIVRDQLSNTCKNSLGSISTVFELSKDAVKELLLLKDNIDDKSKVIGHVYAENYEEQDDTDFEDIKNKAFERIKDTINRLTWDDMQELVAGILRAMGYKTLISSKGADRGKDIIASPDGFGFEHPRIVVEVKHRAGQMGSEKIRSFTGGRHKDDRGLYVSTGGFSKDAKYEAERANIPIMLWSLDELAKALLKYYDFVDLETRQLVPLKRIYFPSIKN